MAGALRLSNTLYYSLIPRPIVWRVWEQDYLYYRSVCLFMLEVHPAKSPIFLLFVTCSIPLIIE